jgi:hypothetical protein
MKLPKTASVCALALTTILATESIASAQTTPTLAVNVVNNTVSMQWTPLPLAQGYEIVVGSGPGGSDVGALPVLAPTTGGTLPFHVPDGQYWVRVRGFADNGNLRGEFSNEVHVVVPNLAACVQPSAPTVAPVVEGGFVTLHWAPIPGAGYEVQWSRFPGLTELTDQTAAASMRKYVGITGTFFARVVAVTPCGNATSAEVPFTIAEVPKRHLSQGEIVNILNQVRAQFPRAFQTAHTNSSEKYDYIILAIRRLYAESGGTVGGNWRRASVGDLSMDGLSVENPADGRYYFADVIFGAGGSNPGIQYDPPFHDGALLRDPSGNYAPRGFVNPFQFNLRTFRNYGPDGGW